MVKISVVVYQFSSHDCLRGGCTGEVKTKMPCQFSSEKEAGHGRGFVEVNSCHYRKVLSTIQARKNKSNPVYHAFTL